MIKAALIVLGVVVTTQSARSQTTAERDVAPRLDDGIPAAHMAQFEHQCDEQKWSNPWIDLTGDGALLRSRSSPTLRRVSVDKLGHALTQLPISDWPYGRVIAVPSGERLRENNVPEEALLMLTTVVLRTGVYALWAWPRETSECAGAVPLGGAAK